MPETIMGETIERDGPRGGDFAAEIAGLQTQFDLLRYMRRVSQAFGFKSFMICHVRGFDGDKLSASALLSNMPAELVSKYDSLAMAHYSVGVRRLKETTTPFCITVEDWERENESSADMVSYLAMLREYGITQANYFPVHDADGRRATVIWMGGESDLTMATMMELQMIAIHVFNRLMEIASLLKENAVTLSEREIQCLNWTAAGKTSAEIAGILGLSEHTVNHYLNHVTKKLDAVNRTQAVVKAIKKGYIS
ncbi:MULTISPECIES: LuxR family transcriptional regulator [unclassified Rhizobium]|uniref:LuxR family transcriptional regulator n=1 Tax=unclassified Rhizobium TaxID=2613769 RepID=UPI0006FE6597|nr:MULTISPECIES: LuxR family transcriptional regulator [unclassified Rhizobium]KQV43735.1 LuxR family transcriptional regulator [Rhizobium sp. Root1212]KRD37919.1 LuxR family transcriptional regulator [Rhizobium sp. Root268]